MSSGGSSGSSTNKTPPVITGIEVSDVKADTATISWKTDKESNGLVEYGLKTDYGSIVGKIEEKLLVHKVILTGLTEKTSYHFRVVSYDSLGNKGISKDQTFTTTGEPSETISDSDKSVIENIAQKIQKLVAPASFASIAKVLEESAQKMIAAPLIAGGNPKVEVGTTTAKITWTTDTNSSSLVAYVPEKSYDGKKTDPYTLTAGKSDDSTTLHEVQITGLEAATAYHYQVRSKPFVGPMAHSNDSTFKTSGLLPEFSNITFEQVDAHQTNATWKTNMPCSSVINYTNLNNGDKKEITDAQFVSDHRAELKDLDSNVSYSLAIKATDEKGNSAVSPTLTFSTGNDVVAPAISQVKTDNAISPRGDKVQAIISWQTDEPATAKVMYQEGAASAKDIEMKSMVEDKTMAHKHTMVLNLRPATVYFFRVMSQDSSANIATSEDFTFLTPQQRKTVIQMIIDNFGKTFSWMQK